MDITGGQSDLKMLIRSEESPQNFPLKAEIGVMNCIGINSTVALLRKKN